MTWVGRSGETSTTSRTATRTIRQGEGPNRETLVVALTANAMDNHRAAWAEVGVTEFLTKPIDINLLTETLQRVCMKIERTEAA